jgi:hypothetical protein
MLSRHFQFVAVIVFVIISMASSLQTSPASVQSLKAESEPRFEEYPAESTFSGKPAAVRLESATYGKFYRTRLRDGAIKGPNFAGSFTIVTWGCGSSCQIVAVVEARTGRLSEQTLRTANGVQFQKTSRLIIADPVRQNDPPLSECASCGTPAAYVWTGTQFQHVGNGPHPHLSGERPQ